jgi:hypothetical protein
VNMILTAKEGTMLYIWTIFKLHSMIDTEYIAKELIAWVNVINVLEGLG